ncbi:thioesterase family protein [Tepidicaulis sp. LMO-SS28]|uniref:thioesterase family protein n=1 Tax=Tepidicaulis sp. LMO-SS28 TaxID=3447455 RepID=UPI003EDEA1B0
MRALYSFDGDLVIPTSDAAGPWDPGMQHGSAPSSLIARAAERYIADDDFMVSRLTIDLMRPVPISPMDVRIVPTREGRQIKVLDIRIVQDGKETVCASVLAVRKQAVDTPTLSQPPALELPLPSDIAAEEDVFSGTSPFVNGLSVRQAKGSFREPGPAAVWYRVNRPMMEGEAMTPLMRAVATGDFCNGQSSALDFTKWTFVNADLAIDLIRYPKGEWVLLDAESWLDAEGGCLAMGKLADEAGYFGTARQHLVVRPR